MPAQRLSSRRWAAKKKPMVKLTLRGLLLGIIMVVCLVPLAMQLRQSSSSLMVPPPIGHHKEQLLSLSSPKLPHHQNKQQRHPVNVAAIQDQQKEEQPPQRSSSVALVAEKEDEKEDASVIVIETPPPLPYEDLPIFNMSVVWEDLLKYDSPLKDKTIPWRHNVYRTWLDVNRTTDPPVMILLTKYGWNQRNQWKARGNIRSMRQRELLEGVLNHKWFHPVYWDEVVEQKSHDPLVGVRYYVFLDLETCMDKNYPHYLNRQANLDQIGVRGFRGTLDHASELKQALRSKFFSGPTANPHNKIVLFDCHGRVRNEKEESVWWARTNNPDERLVLSSVSARPQDHGGAADMGLPPGACTTCNLTVEDHQALCTADRPYLLTFAGNFRADTRKALLELDNEKEGVLIASPKDMQQRLGTLDDPASTMRTLASKSQFAAVPRGDNLFSYRFTEVMGCGAIPVVYADDWVFPFRQELIDAREYAVIIPEADVAKSVEILQTISRDERCRMRRKAVWFYENYLKTGEGVIRGIVDSLELLATKQ